MRWLAVLVLAACGDRVIELEPVQRPARTVAVAPADAPVRYVGVLTAAESVNVAPRIASIILKVHVGVGDLVTTGTVVAEMDGAQMRDELRAAEAGLAASGAAVRQAKVDVEDARRRLALETTAVEKGISPGQNLDEARLGVKRAEANLERALSTLTAEGARVQTARDHLADVSLRAPISGTIAARYRDAGNRVEAGAPILRIVGDANMRLRFAVPPQDAKAFPLGRKVTATVDTVEQPITATVKHLTPGLDPVSGMIIVEAEVPATTAGALRPGLAAWVN